MPSTDSDVLYFLSLLGRQARLNDKASAQLLIGIAGGIGGYGLLGGATLLGSYRTNHPKSQCSRCNCTKNASHEVLPVSPSHESPPDSGDGSKNASTISIGSGSGQLRPVVGNVASDETCTVTTSCCARAASGHATAAPPSATSNFRRPVVTVIRPSRSARTQTSY